MSETGKTGKRPRSSLIRYGVAVLLVAGIVVAIIRVIPGSRGPLPLETLEDATGGPAIKQAEADLHASPAERVDRLTEAVREAERAAPGAGESPRTLLLSARGDGGWMSAIRDLALARPGDLAAAWETLAGDERGRVLDAWRRAAPPPDLARDLRRALAEAGGDGERQVITMLLEALPP